MNQEGIERNDHGIGMTYYIPIPMSHSNMCPIRKLNDIEFINKYNNIYISHHVFQ